MRSRLTGLRGHLLAADRPQHGGRRGRCELVGLFTAHVSGTPLLSVPAFIAVGGVALLAGESRKGERPVAAGAPGPAPAARVSSYSPQGVPGAARGVRSAASACRRKDSSDSPPASRISS